MERRAKNDAYRFYRQFILRYWCRKASPPAQIALRQHIQRGIVIIPKSVHKDRMKQNLDFFDFALTDEEMNPLNTLDENRSMWAEYDDPMIVQYAMAED